MVPLIPHQEWAWRWFKKKIVSSTVMQPFWVWIVSGGWEVITAVMAQKKMLAEVWLWTAVCCGGSQFGLIRMWKQRHCRELCHLQWDDTYSKMIPCVLWDIPEYLKHSASHYPALLRVCFTWNCLDCSGNLCISRLLGAAWRGRSLLWIPLPSANKPYCNALTLSR